MRRFLGVGIFVICSSGAGCQVILGFEDHELASGGGGASTTTSSSTGIGGAGGAGGQAPVIFGSAETVFTHSAPLAELDIFSNDVIAVVPSTGELRRIAGDGGTSSLVIGGLFDPVGLEVDGNFATTTSGDGVANCVGARIEIPTGMRSDVVVEVSPGGAACHAAVTGKGASVAVSNGTRVLVGSVSGGGAGTLIGKVAPDDAASSIAALASGNGEFYWVNPDNSAVYRSDGGSINANQPPPGNGVELVTNGLSTPSDLALRGGTLFVIGFGGVGSVPANATDAAADLLDSETYERRGIEVDATHVYWIDVDAQRLRAVPVNGGAVTTLATGVLAIDVAASGTAVYFSVGNELRRISKTVQ